MRTFVYHVRNSTAIPIINLTIRRTFFGKLAILKIRTIHSIIVRTQEIVRKIPRSHVLTIDFFVNDIALLIEIQSLVARYGHWLSGPVILLEELDGVASSNYACSLILQQEAIRALQDRCVVAMCFQCYAGE